MMKPFILEDAKMKPGMDMNACMFGMNASMMEW